LQGVEQELAELTFSGLVRVGDNLSDKVLMMIVWFQEMEQRGRLVETAAQATDEDAYGKGLVFGVEGARGD
jgi:hypothetical protein